LLLQPKREATLVTDPKQRHFDADDFLASAGLGRSVVQLKAREAFFSQGSEADSIFYLQKGRAKLTVVSPAGKEATLALLIAGDFIGEESIAGAVGRRFATATAISACTALKIERAEMIRVVHEEQLSPISSSSFSFGIDINHATNGTAVVPGVCARRLTWSTSFSTPAKSAWPGFSS
jgi:CRP-like cAMP-binding protein